MNEYEMLYLIRQKNEEAEQILIRLFERRIYRTIIRIKDKLNYCYNTSDEQDELIHFCNQALLGAAESYQDFGGASFSHYAICCIETAIRTYIRFKRSGVNKEITRALPLDAHLSEQEGTYFVDVIENQNPSFDPKSTMSKMNQEQISQQLRQILTEKEYQVYELRLLGYNNREIAEMLNDSRRKICYIHAKIKKLLARHID